MRLVSFVAVGYALVSAVAYSECVEPAQPQIHLPDGRWICTVHRTPIVEEVAFVESRDPDIIDFLGQMERIARCNPNCLYPDASRYRSKKFHIPVRLSYCPICERNMVAAGRRAEAYFRKHGTYPP